MKFKKILLTSALASAFAIGLAGTSKADAATFKTNGYAVAQKQVTVDGVKIPKGTRVQFYKITKKSGKTYANINFSKLSYSVRKSSYGYSDPFRITTSSFKVSSAKAYDALPYQLFKGKSYSKTSDFAQMHVTSNGYVEYYKNNKITEKPYSAKYIYKVKKSGSSTYLYTKSNILGLDDKHVSKTGNYRYRLLVRNRNVTFKSKLENLTVSSYSYSVGGHYFYWFTN